ncbi:hypothetical protein FB45DRAFT_877285 [Roridomyces roridus]|uniref:Uncharacterized protein n=1 Tax=Roridomyces roridus TaxID=1738132 RepID=A0AAD7FB65_9AGAR|nr:hypothetical protein FB45DRAFT_877285 [Roridomyces roridus]
MLPPELVELIIGYGWQYLSTSSHRHAYLMNGWMLVNREWLSIVVRLFLRDIWATSESIMLELFSSWPPARLSHRLAGITNLESYRGPNCRSLTISVYQQREGEYDRQCSDMADYAANESDCISLQWWHREPYFGISLKEVATVIRDCIPNITSLHFVLVDCVPTSFWYWDMPDKLWPNLAAKYPDSLTDLYITFAYTSPPPPLLVDAARGTFFPPRRSSDLPRLFFKFNSIKRLVVREGNADFVAFFTTLCPQLEC